MNFPIIKLEIDSMKYSVMHAFSEHVNQIKEYVDAELKRVLDNFDWAHVIENEMQECLDQIVRDTIKNVFCETNIRNELKKILQKEMQKNLLNIVKNL